MANPTITIYKTDSIRSQAQSHDSLLPRQSICNETLGNIEKLEMSFFQLHFPTITNTCTSSWNHRSGNRKNRFRGEIIYSWTAIVLLITNCDNKSDSSICFSTLSRPQVVAFWLSSTASIKSSSSTIDSKCFCKTTFNIAWHASQNIPSERQSVSRRMHPSSGFDVQHPSGSSWPISRIKK